MLGVEVAETEQDLQALGQEWRELFRQCQDASYFHSWEFASARWEYFAAGRKPWIMAARDASGTLAGLLPLAIAPASVGPLRIRRLEFLCRVEIPFRFERYYLDGERLDIVALPGRRDEVAAAFLGHLGRSETHWDVVDLAWIAPDSLLRAHYNPTRMRVLERTSSCPVAVLPEDWATYERSVLGKSESKQIRKDGRRLERDYPGQVEYHHITERGDIAAALDGLDQMKSRRWDEVGEVSPDEEDAHVRLHKKFERTFIEQAFDRGWLRFYQLLVGGEVIAADCNVLLNGTHYSIKTGFDPDWKAYSPGNLIQAYENKLAIDEGVRVHDLAQGVIETKRKWSNEFRDDVRLIASTSWRGIPYYLREAAGSTAGDYARRLGRRMLSRGTRTRLRRAISNRTRTMRGTATESDSQQDAS